MKKKKTDEIFYKLYVSVNLINIIFIEIVRD